MMHGPMRGLAQEKTQIKDQGKVFSRLIQYIKPYWKYVAGSFVFVLLSAGTQAVAPYLTGRAVDEFITAGDKSGLGTIMLALAGVYFLSMVAMRFQIYLMGQATQRLLADLRVQVMEQVQRLSLKFLEGSDAGDLMSRLVNDIDAMGSFFSQGLSQMIGAFFSLIGIVIAMMSLDWRLALASFVIVPFMLLTTGQFSRWARTAFRKTRETIGDVSSDLQEEISGVKVAQAFNRTGENVSRFSERNAANRDANVQATAVTSAFAPAMDVLSTLDMAIVAGYGGFLAVSGSITVGVVVSFLQYVQNFFRPIQQLSQMWTQAQAALAAAERIFELVDEEAEVEDLPNAIPAEHLDGRVVFEDVTFSYEEGKPVLQNVDILAEPGKTIALVGPTGAGKTTIVGLMMRFYDVDSGKIVIDGTDIRQYEQRSLRSNLGMVLQEPFLFSGSVMDNIRYGRLDASDEEVFAAAKIANAHEFILRMPSGYDTNVGERGGLLSLGQRQLISIARAILADPRILILDEATASVDTRTEALIQEALDQLLKGRTSFVIAHRLSTVRNADLVVVLDEGKVVEQGTHDALLEKGGLYAELYRRQFYIPEEEA